MTVFFTNILIISLLVPFYTPNEITQQDVKPKLTVVIFFTQVDTKCLTLQKNTLGFLNLHEETRVKHSSNEDDGKEKEDTKPSSLYCKDLLKDSLMDLTHFCRTVMKMQTAVASVSSKEMTNDIQEPDVTHVGLGSDTTNKVKRSNTLHSNKDEITQYPDNSKKIITGTKHTEVFEIRVKRNADDEHKDVKVNIIHDYPMEKHTNDHPWDVLDIMKHVRYSFLGKMFENTLKNQIKEDQDDLVDLSKLGKQKQDSGLFSMVKSTLDTLLEFPESNFLMVIFGGHLHAITDKHSPTVQSIKHVIENTDSENTLLVVTGSCANETEHLEGKHNEKSQTLPVYAKGPSSSALSECKLLYDIPLTVRKLLESHTGSNSVPFPEAIST